MAVENALAFLRSLTRRAIPAPIVIAGPQAFLREYIIDRVRIRFAQDGFAYRSFQIGSGTSVDGLLDDLESADLFAPRRFLACRFLRNYREKTGDGDPDGERAPSSTNIESVLIAAIERPNTAVRLAVLCDRDSAPAKLRRAAEAKGVVVNCLRPFDNQLGQYVDLFALHAGIKLNTDAIDSLIGRYGADLAAIANAIARAAILPIDSRALTAADFTEAGATRVPDLFELADAIARGNTSEALGLFNRALQAGRDPIEMLAVEIIPLIRRMLAAAALIEARRTPATIAAALGLAPNSTMLSRALEGARHFGSGRLSQAHHRACRLDEGLKMGLLKDRESGISALLLDLMAR